MFPHIPLQAITLDLADTHSVSLTVERILNSTIYIPGQEGTVATSTPTPIPAHLHPSPQQSTHTPTLTHPHSRDPHMHHSTDTSASESNSSGSSANGSFLPSTQVNEGSDLSQSSSIPESTDTLRQRRAHVTHTAAQFSDSGSSVQGLATRLHERTNAIAAHTSASKANHIRGSLASPLTDPSSIYSFATLQRRKEELLMNARRYVPVRVRFVR